MEQLETSSEIESTNSKSNDELSVSQSVASVTQSVTSDTQSVASNRNSRFRAFVTKYRVVQRLKKLSNFQERPPGK